MGPRVESWINIPTRPVLLSAGLVGFVFSYDLNKSTSISGHNLLVSCYLAHSQEAIMKAIVLKNKVVIGRVATDLTATQQRLLDLGVSLRPIVFTSQGGKRRYLRQLCK